MSQRKTHTQSTSARLWGQSSPWGADETGKGSDLIYTCEQHIQPNVHTHTPLHTIYKECPHVAAKILNIFFLKKINKRCLKHKPERISVQTCIVGITQITKVWSKDCRKILCSLLEKNIPLTVTHTYTTKTASRWGSHLWPGWYIAVVMPLE